MAETAGAAERFSSFMDLQREHAELMRRLRPSAEKMNASQRHSLIDNFIERVKNTGTILDGAERQAAQGILDYWSAEIISASDMGDNWDLPKLLPLEGAAGDTTPPADVIQKRLEARRVLELAATARLWKSSGGDPGYLLEGAALEDAAAHQADPDVAELVRASRIFADSKERERKIEEHERKIKSWFSAAVAVLAGIAIALAAVARQEAQNARISAQSALRAVSEMLGDVDAVDKGTGILPIAATREQLEIARRVLESLSQRPERELAPRRVDLLTKLSDASVWTGDDSKATHEYADEAKTMAERSAKENPSDEEWQRLLYDSTFRIGDLEKDLELKDQEYNRAWQIAQKWMQLSPGDHKWQWRRIFIEYKMGDIALLQKRWEQSRQWYEGGVEFSKRLLDAEPQSLEWRRYEGNGHQRIGDLLRKQGRAQGALVEYGVALGIRNELVGKRPQNRIYKNNLSANYESMGDMLRIEGNIEESLDKYRNALKFADDVFNFDPENVEWKKRRERLYAAIGEITGDLLKKEAHLEEALAQYQTILKFIDDNINKYQSDTRFQRQRARLYASAADIHANKTQFDEAANEYDAALLIFSRIANKPYEEPYDRFKLAVTYGHKGDVFKDRNAEGDLRQAVEAYKRGMAVIDEFVQKDPEGGKVLEKTRKDLQAKIQGLPSDIR